MSDLSSLTVPDLAEQAKWAHDLGRQDEAVSELVRRAEKSAQHKWNWQEAERDAEALAEELRVIKGVQIGYKKRAWDAENKAKALAEALGKIAAGNLENARWMRRTARDALARYRGEKP
jgi:hypothetical protein